MPLQILIRYLWLVSMRGSIDIKLLVFINVCKRKAMVLKWTLAIFVYVENLISFLA